MRNPNREKDDFLHAFSALAVQLKSKFDQNIEPGVVSPLERFVVTLILAGMDGSLAYCKLVADEYKNCSPVVAFTIDHLNRYIFHDEYYNRRRMSDDFEPLHLRSSSAYNHFDRALNTYEQSIGNHLIRKVEPRSPRELFAMIREAGKNQGKEDK